MSKFLYIADPMCSWCYGFSLELQKLIDSRPGSELDIVLGGLRAYNKEVMDDDTRQMILSHWQRVQDVSGLPFDMTGLNKEGFIYDTEPACRAVVTAKLLADDSNAEQSLALFRAVQHGFYAQGLDVTKDEILDMYMNSVYFGEGAFGIDEAARTYFNRSASELDLAQSSML
ncbi:MAG: DsbA family protein, partial [Burkholderiaceae bacterium]